MAAEAETAGKPISRMIVAYEAGQDGFWLAHWLSARGVELKRVQSKRKLEDDSVYSVRVET